MTESQYFQPAHTPGPWHFVGGNQIRSERHQIARVWSMRGGEGTANARLIAAAPQQHDALVAVMYAPGFDGLDDATKNAVRAAIAKAAGGAA